MRRALTYSANREYFRHLCGMVRRVADPRRNSIIYVAAPVEFLRDCTRLVPWTEPAGFRKYGILRSQYLSYSGHCVDSEHGKHHESRL